MRGRVTFQAKGRDWTLRLSSNVLCNIEEAAGCGSLEFFSRFDEGKLRIGDLRLVIQHGLEGDKVTAEEAGDLIDDMGMQAATERVLAAMQAAFPAAEEKPKRGNAKGAAA